MRSFAAPAAYEGMIEGRIAELFDEVRRDMYRREHGDPPLIPDMAIDRGRTGLAITVVGHADDNLIDGVRQAAAKGRAELRSA